MTVWENVFEGQKRRRVKGGGGEVLVLFTSFPTNRGQGAWASQDGDGNVRNQEKTVSVFLTLLQLCLFLSYLKFLPFPPKFYCFILSNYGRVTMVNSQNDAHVLTTTEKWSNWSRTWGTTTPRSCQFTYSRAAFSFLQLVQLSLFCKYAQRIFTDFRLWEVNARMNAETKHPVVYLPYFRRVGLILLLAPNMPTSI